MLGKQNLIGFDYILPEEKIAQRPVEVGELGKLRSDARLLCFNREIESSIKDNKFSELPEMLRPDDLLVLNNSRVIPTRFFSKISEKDTSREVEVLLVEKKHQVSVTEEYWLALARPMRVLKKGMQFSLAPGFDVEVGDRIDERFLKLHLVSESKPIIELIEKYGRMPIPPYIRQGKSDASDAATYQTVYANDPGSVAAPTAGLHFTEEILTRIQSMGVKICYLTLHVGAGSFLPVEDGAEFVMRGEEFTISSETWNAVRAQKADGKRVIAVGTTTVRALESAAGAQDFVPNQPMLGQLFIRPGYEFKIVDALVTNFHQPRSTHLLLVSAFAGVDNVKKMYDYALANDYRFLSYGDAMYILREKLK